MGDSTANAHKAELRLVQQELASKTSVAQVAGRLDEATLEQTREVGRLQGQVDALQGQARESIQREKALREQVLEAEDAARREAQALSQATAKCKVQDEAIQRLQEQLADIQAAASSRREEAREAALGELRAKEQGRRPKCGCSVM